MNMAAEVEFIKNEEYHPIRLELKGESLYFTKKAAIELKNKLQLAIDEMLEHESDEAF